MNRIFCILSLLCFSFGVSNNLHGEIIYDTPQGNKLTYDLTTEQIYSGNKYSFGGVIMHAVKNDNTIWFQDPITAFGFGTWIQGEISDNIIKIPTGQQIFHQDQEDTYPELDLFIVSAVYDKDRAYPVDTDYIELFINRDGTIELPTGQMIAATDQYGAILASNNGYFLKEVDFENEIVTPPDGLEHEIYALHYQEDFFNNDIYTLTDVCKDLDNNKLYIKGLSGEGWIEGKKDGDYFIFNSGQLLGIVNDLFFNYFYSGHQSFPGSVEGYDLDRSLKFYYDSSQDKMTSVDAALEMLGDRILVESRLYPELQKYTPHAAIPAKPKMMDFSSYPEFKVIRFLISPVDENGMYIDPSGITWRLIVDGQPFVFTNDVYMGIESDKEVFKWGETDGDWDIVMEHCGLYNIWLYGNHTTVAAECTYTFGEESHTVISDTMILDPAGIDEIVNMESNNAYYLDLQGRKSTLSSKDIVIKVTRNQEGKIECKKILNIK